MRWFLKSKLSLMIVVLLGITLVAGVALAAQRAQIELQTPEIIVAPFIVEEGTPSLTILGSGFIPDELIFLQIERPEGAIILEGVRANVNRAFILVQELPVAIAPGIYTLKALGTRGSELVTTPLQVVAPK